MIEGRIRDWDADGQVYFAIAAQSGKAAAKRAQARFRQEFTTQLRAAPDDAATEIATLHWGEKVELQGPLTSALFTQVTAGGVAGFVDTRHLVEIAYVGRPANVTDPKKLSVELDCGAKRPPADLLWGDMVQVIRREGTKARARARGLFGTIATSKLTHDPLLEAYFIDVGQGDGVLIRFPDGSHMLIDGGLARERQQTGKNAADFVDWKFFVDYGDWKVSLDWLIASHSDSDHFGGLHDLVDQDQAAREELDTLAVEIGKFGHPGLSRFPESAHPDGLGPRDETGQRPVFTRLMGDRADARHLVDGTGVDGLKISGTWRSFISAVLLNAPGTEFHQLSLPTTDAAAGALPLLGTFGQCAVRVLAPVTIGDGVAASLPDLGEKSINTNGHSVCLRLDFGHARILLTGDLNTASMQWLTEGYGGDLKAWECDVAKACHHGSHDVSFKFLQAIKAGATVISSSDNEGHAHPRPEIVSASALSGHVQLSADKDRVITPLVYMTEIERSVLLAEISRVEVENCGEPGRRATLLGRPVAEYSEREFLSEADWKGLAALDDAPEAVRKAFVRDARDRERPRLMAVEAAEAANATGSVLFGERPTGVVGSAHCRRSLKRLRMMESNIYGLVNVRTDGDLIMCASKRDSGENWTIHAFRARF